MSIYVCLVLQQLNKCPVLPPVALAMLHQLKVIHSCEYCMILPETNRPLAESHSRAAAGGVGGAGAVEEGVAGAMGEGEAVAVGRSAADVDGGEGQGAGAL